MVKEVGRSKLVLFLIICFPQTCHCDCLGGIWGGMLLSRAVMLLLQGLTLQWLAGPLCTLFWTRACWIIRRIGSYLQGWAKWPKMQVRIWAHVGWLCVLCSSPQPFLLPGRLAARPPVIELLWFGQRALSTGGPVSTSGLAAGPGGESAEDLPHSACVLWRGVGDSGHWVPWGVGHRP